MRSAQSSERAIQARASWPAGSLAAMLSDEARSALFQLGVRRVVANGDVLIREQDASAHVILLCQAVVKVTASLENGRAALLGIMVSGDVVGRWPRSATARGAPR